MLNLLKLIPLPFFKRREKPKSIKVLQWVYLFILIFVVVVVFLMHFTESGFLESLRLPTFFRNTQDALNVSYISSLTVYHFTFAYFVLIFTVDIAAFFKYESEFLRRLSLLASIFGFFVFGFMVLYFLYSLIQLWQEGTGITLAALIFFLLSITLFILDLITYLIEERETKLF